MLIKLCTEEPEMRVNIAFQYLNKQKRKEMYLVLHPEIGPKSFKGNLEILAQNVFENSKHDKLKMSSSMDFWKVN